MNDLFSQYFEAWMNFEAVKPETHVRGASPTQLRRLREAADQGRYWDYERFNDVMVLASSMGEYIPINLVPETIHVQGMDGRIKDLKALSRGNGGVEIAQTGFADLDTGNILYGRKTKGTSRRVKIDWAPYPVGKRDDLGLLSRNRRRLLSLHIHPFGQESFFTGHGLSDTDYISFMADPEQRAMVMIFGDYTFLALKTSGTPNNLGFDSVRDRVSVTRDEVLNNRNLTIAERVTKFNKEMCLDFGLCLYMGTPESRNLLSRVNVAR